MLTSEPEFLIVSFPAPRAIVEYHTSPVTITESAPTPVLSVPPSILKLTLSAPFESAAVTPKDEPINVIYPVALSIPYFKV